MLNFNKTSVHRLIKAFVLSAVLLSFGSCVDDNFMSNADFTVVGEDVTIKLAIDYPAMQTRTRAALPDHDLNSVQSLWVATFNANTGKMTTDGWQNTDANPNTSDTHIPHEVTIDTKSGPSYIVAVANVETNYGVKKDDPTATRQTLASLLGQVKDWNDFLNIAVETPSTQNLVNAPNTPLAMAGAYTNAEDIQIGTDSHIKNNVPLSRWQTENFQSYTIPASETGKYTFPDGAIHMRRLVSHVTFNLNPGPGMTIRPHSYTVVNAPKYSWLYERAGARNTFSESVTIDNFGANFGDDCTEENSHTVYYADPIEYPSYDIDSGENGAYTFNFWQGENKHSSIVPITAESDTPEAKKAAYNWRDTQSTTPLDNPGTGYSQTVENTGLFTSLTGESWTPNNLASYVLITCTVDYDNNITVNSQGSTDFPAGTETSDVRRTGEATYLIHLGYMDEDPNDFNCYRNADYTYNVTINGVNDIRVEAYNDGDTPGVEGIVSDVDVQNRVRTHDAHYEKYNIQLTQQELAAYNPENGTGFGFILTTYDNRANDGTVKTYTEKDFINKSFDDLSAKDKRYVDWIELKPTTGQNVLALYTPRGVAGSTTFNLADASRGIQNNQLSASGWYTVFVREYTYDALGSDPADETELYNDYPIWQSYVGASPRRYYIRVTQAVSADGKSIYARSKYAGVQESIASYYALDAKTTSTEAGKTDGSAVGVEHVNESYGLNLRRTFDVTKDRTNGRYNCWLFTGYGYSASSSWTAHNRTTASNGWNYYLDLTAPQKISAFSGNAEQTWSLPKIRNLVNYQNGETSNTTNKFAYSPHPGSNNADDYIEAISACLNRNRDNNGDGVINASEMRWYVPAIGKYLRMLVGQDALQPNQLVNYKTMPRRPENLTDNGFWGEYLFYSSDDYVVWGMEGYSSSPWDYNYSTPPWQVRCIRNLGTNLSADIGTNDQTILAYKYDSTNRIVTPDYYPATTMRVTAYSGNGTGAGQMPVHTIAEEQYNSIYRYGFQVSDVLYSSAMSASNTSSGGNYYSAWNWENMRDYINTNPEDHRNPCTQLNTNGVTGWRLPNVKEMAIMKNLELIDVSQAPILSCSMGVISQDGTKVTTTSNPTTNGGDRYINGNTNNNNMHNFMCTNNYNGDITQSWFGTYNIRCVRDYTGGR